MIFLAVFFLILAVIPVLMTKKNLSFFFRAPTPHQNQQVSTTSGISVLIPARNEAHRILSVLDALANSKGAIFEVVVLDDHSTDTTKDIVESFAKKHAHFRLESSKALPPGWNGKMHACWQLAHLAKFELLLFLDADVELSSDALVRMATLADQKPGVALFSGFPKQIACTWSEKLLIPMMHYILLSYLPIEQMRASNNPAFAAGCGQLMLARKKQYLECGGHSAVKATRHDGVALPRAFRDKAMSTDIFDATDIAGTRMYVGFKEVVQGAVKNATEGLAHPKRIAIFSMLLLGGSVLPLLVMLFMITSATQHPLLPMYVIGCLLCFVPRIWVRQRFQQSWLGAILHPLAVMWFVLLQWWALGQQLLGTRVLWKGRES